MEAIFAIYFLSDFYAYKVFSEEKQQEKVFKGALQIIIYFAMITFSSSFLTDVVWIDS